MSHFLSQLATLALGAGTPAGARLALPSRFATQPAVTAQPPVTNGEELPNTSDAAAHARSEAAALALRLDVRPQAAERRVPTSIGPAQLATDTRAPPADPDRVRQDSVVAAATQQAHLAQPPAEAEPLRATLAAFPSLSDIAEAVAQATSRTRGSIAAPASSPHAPSPARAAPLGESVLAARTQATPSPTSSINVTIDRIEVRAAAPEKPQAARPRTRAPMISLSDYLRAGIAGITR